MAQPPGPIFLVGFMGTGKTTIGAVLARLLGWDFVDMDGRIAEQEGRSIAGIFARDGEAYFRRLEIGLLESLRGRTRVVVACGGGTYARDEGRALIDALGRSVWLHLPLEQALARCAPGRERPLLEDAAQAERLYRDRLPAYRAAALRIDVEGLDPQGAAERIAAAL